MDKQSEGAIPLTCDEMRQILAEAAGGRLDEQRWAVADRHLGVCPRCANALHSLREAILEIDAMDVIHEAWASEAVSRHALTATDAPSFRWDSLGRLIIALHQGLRRSWPAPNSFASQGLKAQDDARILHFFYLEDELREDDVRVAITVRARPDDTTRADVLVDVAVPSRGGWPHLDGSVVTLKIDDRLLATRLTDKFGQAVFPSVSITEIPHLVFEISPIEGI